MSTGGIGIPPFSTSSGALPPPERLDKMSKRPVEQLLVEIDDFSRARKLSKKEMAQKLNMPYGSRRARVIRGIRLQYMLNE